MAIMTWGATGTFAWLIHSNKMGGVPFKNGQTYVQNTKRLQFCDTLPRWPARCRCLLLISHLNRGAWRVERILSHWEKHMFL